MAKASDLIGNRYGKLLVIERAENNKRGNTQWLCKCDCGKTKVALGYDLTHGRTVSCGCNNIGKPSKKRVDITGKRYGKLVVESLNEQLSKPTCLIWNCKCDCGNSIVARGGNLKIGHTKSCGCTQRSEKPFDDITGNRYGNLVVLGFVRKTKYSRIWLCRCDCGNKKEIKEGYLKSGTPSCGCLSRKALKTTANKTHGMSKTRLYTEWKSAIQRCKKSYHNSNLYYDRGITVCEEWLNSFESFRDWALDNNYDDTLTLDRIDNNKGYSPDNCRWVTMKEQQNNRRNNVLFTINGETKTMKQWSEYFNIPYGTVKARHRKNKPIDELFAPVRSYS